jgi:hypothetical protein
MNELVGLGIRIFLGGIGVIIVLVGVQCIKEIFDWFRSKMKYGSLAPSNFPDLLGSLFFAWVCIPVGALILYLAFALKL